jgi:hypothetical protein
MHHEKHEGHQENELIPIITVVHNKKELDIFKLKTKEAKQITGIIPNQVILEKDQDYRVLHQSKQ